MAGKTAAPKSSGKTDAAGAAADVAAGALNSGLGKVANDLGFGDSYISSASRRAPSVAGGDISVNPSVVEISRGISRNNSLVNQMVTTLDITNDLLSSQISLQRESNRYLRAIYSSLGSMSTGGGINILGGGGAGTGKPQGFGGKAGSFIGSLAGGTVGAIAGAASPIPGGSLMGGIVGSATGESAGNWIGEKIGSFFSGSSSSEGAGSIFSSITGLGNLSRPSAKADIGSKRSYSGVSGNAAANKAMNYFMSQGWTREQAAGIVANLMVESGNFDPNVINGTRRGDGGKAVGIAQWRGTRQIDFYNWSGKRIEDSSFEEQLAFVQYELSKGKEQKAGNEIKKATSAAEAAALVDRFYERSAGIHRKERMVKAESLAGSETKGSDQTTSSAAAPTGGAKESSQKPGGLISTITGAFSSVVEKFSRPSAGGGSSATSASSGGGTQSDGGDNEYRELPVRKKLTGPDVSPKDVGRYANPQERYDTLSGMEGRLYNLGGGLTGNAGNVSRLNPELQKALAGALAEYRDQTGRLATITSGHRTSEEQSRISSPYMKARSGKSRHETGNAVDISSRDAAEMERLGILQKYGLHRPYGDKDPVHIELRNGGQGSPDEIGYDGMRQPGANMMRGSGIGGMIRDPFQAIGSMMGGRFGGPMGAMLGGMAGAALSGIASSLFGGSGGEFQPAVTASSQPQISGSAFTNPMQQFNQMFGGADYSGAGGAQAFFAADKAALTSPQVSTPMPPPKPMDINRAPIPPLPPPRPPEFSAPTTPPTQSSTGDFGRSAEMDRYADIIPSTSMPSDITTAIAGMFNYNKKGDPTIASIYDRPQSA